MKDWLTKLWRIRRDTQQGPAQPIWVIVNGQGEPTRPVAVLGSPFIRLLTDDSGIKSISTYGTEDLANQILGAVQDKHKYRVARYHEISAGVVAVHRDGAAEEHESSKDGGV